MLENTPDNREQALSLHHEGRLDAAQAVYEALLAAAPEDAELLGLLGVLAMQQGRDAEARALLGRALDAGGEPRIRLRNLNNALVLAQREGDKGEARGLIADGVPDWPEGVVPDPAERATVLSLAEVLALLDEPDTAMRLLERAIPNPDNDAAALGLAGRLRLAMGDTGGAAAALARAVELAPDDQWALMALGAALDQLGRRADANGAAWTFAKRFPFHGEPHREGQTATILVLNAVPGRIKNPDMDVLGLHFRNNYPSQFVHRMADRYRFLSVFMNIAPDARPWEGEGAAVVLNNLANEEAANTPGAEDAARALAGRIGLPVINHPKHLSRMSREENAELLAGILGLKVPRIARYRLADGGIDAIIADIGDRFGYPVILRAPGVHMSSNSLIEGEPKTAYLARNVQEVRAAVAEAGWSEFYAIEYVDLRNKEGWYRKVRAAVVGNEIVVSSGGYYNQWMVSGMRGRKPGIEFYRANPEAFRKARAFLVDPEGELGADCLATLQRLRERIPLDIFGIDFDVDDAGQVVFFEASAAMIFPHPTHGVPPDLAMPPEPLERIFAAFHDLVARRIAEGAG